MKISLSSMQAFCLAEVFAREIHAQVIRMHLWTCDHIFHTPEHPFAVKEPDRAFNEVCAAIRSIKAGSWERKTFVGSVKYHFQRLRKEHGTDVKWQQHVERVKAINSDIVPVPFLRQAA